MLLCYCGYMVVYTAQSITSTNQSIHRSLIQSIIYLTQTTWVHKYTKDADGTAKTQQNAAKGEQ